MIQRALTEKVAPILHATVGTVVDTCAHMDSRLQQVEEDIKALKIRCVWLEKYMFQAQADVAKRTILARGWPDWVTAEDRNLTINTAILEAGLNAQLVDIANLTQID